MSSMNYKLTRILASLIDGLVMLILLVAICIAPSLNLAKGIINDNYVMGDILWLVFSFVGSVLVWILYLSLTGLIFKNATLGMKLTRLAFVRTNGTELMFINIFAREAVLVICLIFSFGFSIVLDPISLLCSENGKNFHDIFSSTKVVSLYELD
ncbi:MAG: RDD family protein [Bacilli bacterium]|nr:RDD family protein [Bacilli bacterium]